MTLNDHRTELDRLEQTKTFKKTLLESEQGAVVRVAGATSSCWHRTAIWTGVTPKSVKRRCLREYGHGVASVRFLCGTPTIHRRSKSLIFRNGRRVLYSLLFQRTRILCIDRQREAGQLIATSSTAIG
jgi:hypothetical protein